MATGSTRDGDEAEAQSLRLEGSSGGGLSPSQAHSSISLSRLLKVCGVVLLMSPRKKCLCSASRAECASVSSPLPYISFFFRFYGINSL